MEKDLDKKLNELEGLISSYETELETLKQDPSVSRYLKLIGTITSTKKEIIDVKKEIIIRRCKCCSHKVVRTNCEHDGWEGRNYAIRYGCIKCGLDENYYYDDSICEEYSEAYREYISKYGFSRSNFIGLYPDNHYMFLRLHSRYLELRNNNPNFTEEDIINKIKSEEEKRPKYYY